MRINLTNIDLSADQVALTYNELCRAEDEAEQYSGLNNIQG
jgi:hypothetical protein